MLRQFAYRCFPGDSQNCDESLLQPVISRQQVTTFIPGTRLKSKGFHILPIRFHMRPFRTHPGASPLERLDRVTRIRQSRELALDLLYGCGMMPKSEERWLVGREVRGHASSLVTAGAWKDLLVASFPLSLPQILSASSLLYQRKIKFPLVNLFGMTLRLNERLGCHDPFIEWAR
jgi:hypothetical protein